MKFDVGKLKPRSSRQGAAESDASGKLPGWLAGPVHDLNKQGLLPLVLLLIVAIPVVILLFGSSAAQPPVSTSVPTDKASDEDGFVVVADSPGLRNPLDRFDSGEARDPFVGPDGTTVGGDPSASSSDQAGESTPPAPPPSQSTGGSSGLSTSSSRSQGSSGSSSPPPSPPGSGGSGGSGGGTTTITKTEFVFVGIDATATFGRAGTGRQAVLDPVPKLMALPRSGRPAVVYLGASALGFAMFSVSPDVVRVDGKGRCSSGRPTDCGYLFLAPGQAVNMLDARRGTVWRLAVRGIDAVEADEDLALEIVNGKRKGSGRTASPDDAVESD